MKNVSAGVSFCGLFKLTIQSKNLHILLHTLSKYLATNPLPPLSPALPDMHSSTQAYIALQNLYKEQHKSDLAKFRSVLASVLEEVGLPADAVPDEEVEGFVKNTSAVAIIKGTPLRESKEGGVRLKEAIGMSGKRFARLSTR